MNDTELRARLRKRVGSFAVVRADNPDIVVKSNIMQWKTAQKLADDLKVDTGHPYEVRRTKGIGPR